ncbi:MAG: LysR family transcriptional regulator [Granulosicoccaceae bacterium]
MRIPHGFDLKALEIFSCVARERSMTAAARQLQLSQSTISHTVSQLENSLGVQLLDRAVRPPALTQAGQSLQIHAEELLERSVNALRDARNSAGLTLPTLRIAMVDSFAAVVGPSLVKTLQDEAQHWRVWSGLSPGHLDALADHQVDFIVGDHPADPRVQRLALVTEPFLLALPHNDTGPTTSLAAVAARLPLVRYSLRSRIGQQVEDYLNRCDIHAPMALEFDTAPAQLAMIGAGLGWGLTTPLCALHAKGELHKLRLLPLPGKTLNRELTLLSRNDELPALAERIARAAQEIIQLEQLPQLQAQFNELDLKHLFDG